MLKTHSVIQPLFLKLNNIKKSIVFNTEKQRSKLHKSLINSDEANTNQISDKLENLQDKKCYTVFWQDFSQERNNGSFLELKIDANPATVVEDFLANIINRINKRLTESRSSYMLSNNKDLFGLMIAKKNGEPKTDYPGFFYYSPFFFSFFP